MKKAAIILMRISCASPCVAAEAARTGTRPLRSKAPSTRQYRIPIWSRYESEHAQVSYQHEE